MKITAAKIGLLALATGIAIALSSFTNIETAKVSKTETTVVTSEEDEWEEYGKVSDFIYTNISKEVQKHNKNSSSKTMIFSRCPSGYEPSYTSDSVKVDRYVYGKIQNYVGCKPTYVCNFKVCVNKKIALIKGKDEKEYIAVKDWIKMKYGAQQVKG